MSRTLPVVIGVGNEYRRDDGIGPAVIAALERRDLPGVRLLISDGEPAGLLDAWSGSPLAIVIDAVLCEPADPGAIHRTDLNEVPHTGHSASSHSLGIPDALRLARALDRTPTRLVVYAVEAADVDFGTDLSAPVAAALPHVVTAVLTELSRLGGWRGSP